MNKILKENLVSLLSFEFLVNIIVIYGLNSFVKLLFAIALKITSNRYLTQENALSIFLNPIVIVLTLVCLFVLTVFILLELYVLNIFFIAAKRKEKLNLLGAFTNLKYKLPELLKNRNLFLFIHAVILLPFTGIIYRNPVLSELRIPNFILDTLSYDYFLALAIFLLFVFCFAFVYLNSYTFLFMISEGQDYFTAMKSSVKLVRETKFKIFGVYIKLMIYWLLWWIIIFLAQSLFYNLSSFFKGVISFGILSVIAKSFNLSVIAIFDIAIKVCGIYAISDLFYSKISLPSLKPLASKDFRLKRSLAALLVLVLFSISTINVFETMFEKIPYGVSVIAHRGSNSKALENSEEAILLAIDQGAKHIEIDVVLSKDKVPVVYHDFHLKRLTGVNALVSDLNIEELKKLELKDIRGKKGRIYTLDEIVQKVGNRAILNVEIKTSEEDLKIISKLTEFALKDYKKHMVCSLNSKVLKEIKTLNPNRRTGLIMAFGFGTFEKEDFVDFYSIEEKFINKKLVNKIHSEKKQVYVWTVNDIESIKKHFDMCVDGIITDYPSEVLSEINFILNSINKFRIEKLFFGDSLSR